MLKPRFEFIRALYADLGEDRIAAAEAHFAALLDLLADAFAEHALRSEARNTDSTECGTVPYS